MNEHQDPKHKLEFVLKVKIKFYDKWVQDHDRRYQRRLVLLVPERNTQAERFFLEWLPDTTGQYFEAPSTISSPIDSPCRVSVHRGPDKQCENHYLTVMSKGVEDLIKQYKKEGDILEMRILDESDDEVMDQMVDSSGDFDLIDGQTEL